MQPQDTTPPEEWRPLSDYGTAPDGEHHTRYEVSNLGRVRSVRYCIRRPYVTDRGYAHVHLYNNSSLRPTAPRVSRLVAAAFHGTPTVGMEANHKDGNKANNSASNLEWVTSSQNKRHAITLGLWKPRRTPA